MINRHRDASPAVSYTRMNTNQLGLQYNNNNIRIEKEIFKDYTINSEQY